MPRVNTRTDCRRHRLVRLPGHEEILRLQSGLRGRIAAYTKSRRCRQRKPQARDGEEFLRHIEAAIAATKRPPAGEETSITMMGIPAGETVTRQKIGMAMSPKLVCHV